MTRFNKLPLLLNYFEECQCYLVELDKEKIKTHILFCIKFHEKLICTAELKQIMNHQINGFGTKTS